MTAIPGTAGGVVDGGTVLDAAGGVLLLVVATAVVVGAPEAVGTDDTVDVGVGTSLVEVAFGSVVGGAVLPDPESTVVTVTGTVVEAGKVVTVEELGTSVLDGTVEATVVVTGSLVVGTVVVTTGGTVETGATIVVVVVVLVVVVVVVVVLVVVVGATVVVVVVVGIATSANATTDGPRPTGTTARHDIRRITARCRRRQIACVSLAMNPRIENDRQSSVNGSPDGVFESRSRPADAASLLFVG